MVVQSQPSENQGPQSQGCHTALKMQVQKRLLSQGNSGYLLSQGHSGHHRREILGIGHRPAGAQNPRRPWQEGGGWTRTVARGRGGRGVGVLRGVEIRSGENRVGRGRESPDGLRTDHRARAFRAFLGFRV